MAPGYYSHRSVIVLSLLGTLSAFVSVLSVVLIFQLQGSSSPSTQPPPPHRDAAASSALPAGLRDVLRPVSTVLSALALTLNLSSVAVCLLHSYFSAETCGGGGEQDAERADWFLLESRAVRHVAIGLFCLGVSVYLAAMSIYMLLIFEVETGIASACVLSSGILILLIVVIHSLVKSSQTAGHNQTPRHNTLFQNQHGSVNAPLSRPGELKVGADKPRMPRSPPQPQRQMSYPPCAAPKHHEPPLPGAQQYSPARVSQSHASEKDGYSSGGSSSRMHRTLSTDLLQAPIQPWNGVNNEMRSILARKSGVSAKDSTLV
ncbi:unnamed protein product [Merluccius merluccius]